MNQAVADFTRSFMEAYHHSRIALDMTYQVSALTKIMEEYAPKLTQTKMYEIIYDMYIEEQTPLLNQCLEMISGWDMQAHFEFLEV